MPGKKRPPQTPEAKEEFDAYVKENIDEPAGIWVPSRPKAVIGQDPADVRASKQEEADRQEALRERYTLGYGPSICGVTTILIGGVITCLSVVYCMNYL